VFWLARVCLPTLLNTQFVFLINSELICEVSLMFREGGVRGEEGAVPMQSTYSRLRLRLIHQESLLLDGSAGE
jgi:hypothetical protein